MSFSENSLVPVQKHCNLEELQSYSGPLVSKGFHIFWWPFEWLSPLSPQFSILKMPGFVCPLISHDTLLLEDLTFKVLERATRCPKSAGKA